MPLLIVRNDITKMSVDAIVNAANSTLLGGGGVDGAIHRAAGPGLTAECRTLGGCPVGQAKLTGGYNLPCKYVIHTVGPFWRGGDRGEAQTLAGCYRHSLYLARVHECESVAFPLISAGAYGYPKDQAVQIAVETINEFLETAEMTVYLVLFDRGTMEVLRERYESVQQFIDDHYVQRHIIPRQPVAAPMAMPEEKPTAQCTSLDDAVGRLDESFSEMLLRKIDEKGMTDAQCYKKANIDRKLFSKIRSDRNYRPSKPTVLSFAVALELPLAETREMLMKAGFALSRSQKFDVIVEYFISRGIYDVHEINQALFAFDQSLLGN